MTMPISEPAVLMTPRCRLRPLVDSDAGLLELYASDERVARMTTDIPHPYPPGTADAFIARHAGGKAGQTIWAIDRRDDDGNALIGIVSLKARGDNEAGITYWVAPAYWGSGLASEAVAAVVSEAPLRGLSALSAEVLQDNAAALKVLSRCGFEYAGEGSAHSIARQAVVPTFRYRLIPDGATV